MSKKTKILIFFAALLIWMIPQESQAIIGTGIFDFFDTALGGIEEFVGPVGEKLLSIFFTYVTGLIFLDISAGVLQFVTENNTNWLTLSDNSMVQAGWNFTAGFANMFLILILLAIAFGFILKIENLQMKKSLPRLLIVALLINFSLVFVEMLLDISNIIYNTFLFGNTNLPSYVINSIGAGGESMMTSLATWISALLVSFMIPFVSPFAQVALAGTVLIGFSANFIAWFSQIFCFFAVGGIFFTYALLFIARIFIIQLLAIIAPLAFVAMILPQTKKYWDKWLATLLEWLFFGVSLFFFMVLGMKLLGAIMPPGGLTPAPIGGLGEIKSYFIYYLFLTAYMIVTLFVSKKMMPSFAQAIVDQAVGLGKMAWGMGAVPLGRFARERLDRFSNTQQKKEEEIEAKMSASDGRMKLSGGERITMGLGRWARKTAGIGYRIAGTSPTAGMERELEAKAAEYGKRYGTDYKGAASIFGGLSSDFDQAALMMYLEKTKGGKALGRLNASQLAGGIEAFAKYRPNKMTDILRHMPELADEEESMKKFGNVRGKQVASIIQNAIVSDGLARDPVTLRYKDNDVQKLADAGTGQANLLKEAAMKKTLDDMKSTDLDAVEMKLGSNKTFQRILAKWKNDRGFIQRAIEKWGPGFGKEIQDIAQGPNGKDLSSSARTNPSFILMQTSQFGQTFMENWKGQDSSGNVRILKGKDALKTFVQQARTSAPTWQPIQGLPTISPQPTDQDKNRFASYAEGTRKAPVGTDEGALRDIRGAINALAYRMQESNNEIGKLGREISSATGAEREALEQMDRNLKEKHGEYEIRDHQFKDQEDIIKKKLAEELQKKVRK